MFPARIRDVLTIRIHVLPSRELFPSRGDATYPVTSSSSLTFNILSLSLSLSRVPSRSYCRSSNIVLAQTTGSRSRRKIMAKIRTGRVRALWRFVHTLWYTHRKRDKWASLLPFVKHFPNVGRIAKTRIVATFVSRTCGILMVCKPCCATGHQR